MPPPFDPSQVAIASDLEALKIGCLYFPAVVPHSGISDGELELAMGCLDRGLMERVLAWRDERAAGLLPSGPTAVTEREASEAYLYEAQTKLDGTKIVKPTF